MSILFQSDYRKRPVYIHPTKNISAIRTSMILKTMGIANHQFLLTTYDRDLLHIDPHNRDHITPTIAHKIWLECRDNIWYFLREVVRVPTTAGNPVPFGFHRANVAMAWCFHADISQITTIARQLGKTIGTQCLAGQVIYFSGYNTDFAMLTKDSNLLIDNVLRLKDIRDALPQYLIQTDAAGIDKDAKEGLSYTALQNRYLTFINANTTQGAAKLGRGQTLPIIHIDEIAFFRYIDITYPAVMAATTQAAEDAKASGQRCANILTTTAGRPDEPSGAYALSIVNKAALFEDKMYDCVDREDLVRLIQANSNNKDNDMVYICYSHRQLGRTDEWMRKVISRVSAPSPDVVARDFFNVWMAGSDVGVIPTDLLMKINNSVLEPKYVDIEDNFVLRWYVEPDLLDMPHYKEKFFIIGLDSSESIGSDFTAMVVLDPDDSSVIATMRSNDTNIIKLARRIVSFMLKFPNSILVPEAKSTGRAIIDLVIDELSNHNINPWKRIYNTAIQKKEENAFKDFNIYSELPTGLNRKLFGYATVGGTGVGSRNYLYQTVMMKALYLNHTRVRDQILCRELASLTLKNGRVDHGSDGHDDMVISYLLACFFIFFGRNHHMYGLEKLALLSHLSGDGSVIDPNKRKAQLELQNNIDKLEQKLTYCQPSDLIKHSYIREIRKLREMVDSSVIPFDPITKEAMDNRTRIESGKPTGLTVENADRLMNTLF